MRKIILLLIAIFIHPMMIGQMNKKLNDPSIVAQEKRMVFEAWGDWRPYPKYFLGIQTNVNYAFMWGKFAPSRNRKYRKGKDIRPLKVDGEETLRLATAYQMKKNAENIKISVDSLSERAIADFAHITHHTANADPLWLLYYKRMLKPLKNFPNKPSSANEWQIKDENLYQKMIKRGEIKNLQKDLDLLKDKYEKSKKIDMPRGKRILMYHDVLIGWRKFRAKINALNERNKNHIEFDKVIKILKGDNDNYDISTSDTEEMKKIMKKYRKKF